MSSDDWKDYDIVPSVSVEPSKKRAYRKTLPGQTCPSCEHYYKMSGSCDRSSRHRGETRSKTPEDFWNLDFPEHDSRPVGVYEMGPLETNRYYLPAPRKRSPQPTPLCQTYPAEWDNLWKWCLQTHYQKNSHHPEYYPNPDVDMTKEDRMELTCDLLGSVKGHALHHNICLSLEQCRAVVEHQKWRHWKYALTECLPAAAREVPSLPPRWKKFPVEEKDILKRMYDRLRYGRSSESDIEWKICSLDSVRYYKRDLRYHRIGVEEMWKSIPEFHTDDMECRIASHDLDKYKVEMIIGYTSQWCF